MGHHLTLVLFFYMFI